MKLHWSPRSPFVRKVMIAAHETGLAGRLTLVRTMVAMTAPNALLLADNQAMNYLISGKPPARSGNAHPNIQPQDVFACKKAPLGLRLGKQASTRSSCSRSRKATRASRATARNCCTARMRARLRAP